LRAAGAIAVVLLSCGVARADEQAEAARIHFQAGREYYADGKHEKAFPEFVEAYRLSRRPELLFNRGLCLQALRFEAEALACYREYLASAMALDRSDPERRVKELSARVPSAAVPASCPEALPVIPPPPIKRTPVYKRWWLWTVVGVVVAGAVAGGVTAGLLKKQHDELPVFPGTTP
jgi:hypothetical protein